MVHDSSDGFTLPELLIAGVVLLAMMAGSLFLLHSKDYTSLAHNAQRGTDVARLMQAVNAYAHDHHALPPGITTDEQPIGSASDETNLCPALLPAYIKIMPVEPLLDGAQPSSDCNKSGKTYVTGYAIHKSADGKSVTIRAPLSEDALVSITHTPAL
jgi:type II secretory pathway pseudopilin PulG